MSGAGGRTNQRRGSRAAEVCERVHVLLLTVTSRGPARREREREAGASARAGIPGIGVCSFPRTTCLVLRSPILRRATQAVEATDGVVEEE